LEGESAVFANNVGMTDRIVRIVVGLALIAFALGYLAPGVSYRWIGWIGIIPLATAVFGTCPLYSVLGMSTCSAARTH
jgi:hypothetical protein